MIYHSSGEFILKALDVSTGTSTMTITTPSRGPFGDLIGYRDGVAYVNDGKLRAIDGEGEQTFEQDLAQAGSPRDVRLLSPRGDDALCLLGNVVEPFSRDYKDVRVIRFNADGSLAWPYTWRGGAGGLRARLVDAELHPAGGVTVLINREVLTDVVEPVDFIVESLTADGELRWSISSDAWGSSGRRRAKALAQARDGAVYVASALSGLARIEPDGSPGWADFTSPNNIDRLATGPDGLVAASTLSNRIGGVSVFDEQGDLLWQSDLPLEALSIVVDLAFDGFGQLAVAAKSHSRVYLARYGANTGEVLWSDEPDLSPLSVTPKHLEAEPVASST